MSIFKKTGIILITFITLFVFVFSFNGVKADTSNGVCLDKDGGTLANVTTIEGCIAVGGEWIYNYAFLAPLGEKTDINTAEKNALANYVNLIVKVAIGIAAVLSVIMIVMGGIQYMTSELISSKEEGKKRITNAVLGLLIALGAYLILFTVNPNLLDVDPKLDSVSITFEEEEDFEPITSDTLTRIPTNKPVNCSVGVTRINTSGGIFIACADIANNFKKMIDDAWKAGKKITGGGFRTPEKQISLRRSHCGTSQYDIYEKPSGSCRPPTARPGRSVHESGKAFDLRCDGKLIFWDNNPKNRRFPNNPSTKTCFDWLRANASRYGFYNLPSENWHWSVNGK